MSDELTIGMSLQFAKNGLSLSRLPGNKVLDVAGDHASAGTQEVGTSAENLSKGDITTSGYLMIHNLDETNYVEVGYDDSGFKPTVKLLPGAEADGYGDWAIFRSAQATLQVKADTAACDVEFYLIEA